MKRIVCFALLAMALTSCGVSQLVLDKTYKGKHVALTSNSYVFTENGGSYDFALGTRMSEKDTLLAVLVTYDGDSKAGIFDKDDRLMFRLSDGTEFNLRNIYDKEFESSDELVQTQRMKTDYLMQYTYSPLTDMIYVDPIVVTRSIPEIYRVKKHNSYGLYPITKSQLNGIITKGVAKMRVESLIGDNDVPHPEELSDTFKGLYECLSTAFTSKPDTSF